MAERLADGVWLLDLGLFRPLTTNCYLLDDGDVTLVDTGLWVNRPSMRSELADAGYDASDVDRVVLTHYDLDHTTGLAALDGHDVPVYLGTDDVRLVSGEWRPPLFHHKGAFHRIARRFFPLPDDVDLQSVDDGDRVGGLLAFHTPGHNPGHTAFVHEELGACLVGDLVWGEPGDLAPPFWLDSYDMHELNESIRDLAARAPPFDLLCMGHGTPVTENGRAALRDLAASLE